MDVNSNGEEAISVIIGVILMVGVAIAIATAMYFHAMTMTPEAEKQTPDIQWNIHQADNTIEIIRGDTRFKYAATENDANLIFKDGSGNLYYVNSNFYLTGIQSGLKTDEIAAGDLISCFLDHTTYHVIWDPADRSIGSIDFT